MKKANTNFKCLCKLKFATIVCFLFLLYFFSNTLIYAQSSDKNNSDYLIPIGSVIQIDAELENLIVRNQVDNTLLFLGDSLISINNKPIHDYSDFARVLSSLSEKEKALVVIRRGSHDFTLNISKDKLEEINFNNLLSGFATLTYINPNTLEFGAVGHPISIGNHRKIAIKNGYISTTTNLAIQKSFRGSVGCISAKRKDSLGQFTHNSDFGIRGKISENSFLELPKYKVANLKDVRLGKAQIIMQTDSKTFNKYDIQIIDIQNQKSPKSKTFKIRITDKDLLIKTGGIVQGMSGTPIIQDNKIIGAISHAVENDPALGYGVFIQWMIDN